MIYTEVKSTNDFISKFVLEYSQISANLGTYHDSSRHSYRIMRNMLAVN